MSSPRFTEDGRDIYFRLEDSGSNQLARVRASGGDVVREIGGEVSVRDYSMANGVIVVSLADATSPSELYAFDGALARLTEVSGHLWQVSPVRRLKSDDSKAATAPKWKRFL